VTGGCEGAEAGGSGMAGFWPVVGGVRGLVEEEGVSDVVCRDSKEFLVGGPGGAEVGIF
jgi:hypothetical protein